MNTEQITEIIGSDNMNERLYIDKIHFLGFEKDKQMVFSDVQRTRFLFDTTHEILEVSYCRPYSQTGQTPVHGEFDTYTVKGKEIIFEYLLDENKELVIDYYPFDSLITINLRGE